MEINDIDYIICKNTDNTFNVYMDFYKITKEDVKDIINVLNKTIEEEND